MVKLTSEIRDTIRLARQKGIINAWKLVQTSVELFQNAQYPTACFLAMTAIEELGKLSILQIVQGDIIRGLNASNIEIEVPDELDAKELSKFLRNHLDKAVQAASTSLYINAGADRRHGINPQNSMHRTSGVILLARSGQWMNIRNNCLYTDINFASKSTTSPSEFISREHAYYFICMGFEILAEQAEAGLGSAFESSEQTETSQFWQKRLNELEDFMTCWSTTVELNALDFLANPQPLREEAEKREAKKAKKKK